MIKNNLSLFTKKYLKHNFVLVVLISIGKILSFGWKTLLLKESIELVGEIEVLLTTLGLLLSITSLAFPSAFGRFSLINKKRTKEYGKFAFIQTVKIFILISLIILTTSILFSDFYQKIFIIPFISFSLLLFSVVVQEFFLVFLNIKKRFTGYGVSKFILQPGIKIFFLGLILLGVISKRMLLDHVVWSIFLTTLITGLFLIKKINLKKETVSLQDKEKKGFLSYSRSLSGSLISFIVYGSVDIYLIQYFLGNFSVGIYSAIFMGINAMELLFSPFLQTFQVHLSEKKQQLQKQLFTQRTSYLLIVLGILMGLLIFIVLPPFLKYVLSIENINKFVILFFIIAKIIHSTIVLLLRHYLDFEGEEKFTLKTMGLSLLLKTFLGIILIPRMGLLGLAIAQITAELIHVLLLKRKTSFFFNPNIEELKKPFYTMNS
jgi:O-antigen/teichoic acid export membrane protein